MSYIVSLACCKLTWLSVWVIVSFKNWNTVKCISLRSVPRPFNSLFGHVYFLPFSSPSSFLPGEKRKHWNAHRLQTTHVTLTVAEKWEKKFNVNFFTHLFLKRVPFWIFLRCQTLISMLRSWCWKLLVEHWQPQRFVYSNRNQNYMN